MTGKVFVGRYVGSFSCLGYYKPRTKTIHISSKILNLSDQQIIDIIKHEVAHAYVDVMLYKKFKTNEEAHGLDFQMVCEKIGCNAKMIDRSVQPKQLKHKYSSVCQCGQELYINRLVKGVRHLCKKCKTPVIWQKNY